MPMYFFVLGRNPELSIAELYALLPKECQFVAHSKEIQLVRSAPFKMPTLIKRAGGTIKGGEILVENNLNPVEENLLLNFVKPKSKLEKIFIGFSAYALEEKSRLPSIHELRKLGIGLKRLLTQEGYKVRLVTSKEIALASVIVKREKLLSQGTEMVLIYGGKASGSSEALPRYIGRTLAVQEFAEASRRDFGRPERSMGVGMLPVQLAKIMLNLSGVPLTETVLDPFCGFGTILSEALAMGYTKLIGSDSEQKMIDATQKNLGWLSKTPPHHNSPLPAQAGQPSLILREGVRLIATPVEQLSEHLSPNSVDAIVTEPYMGPTRQMVNGKWPIAELETLYIAAFREFAKILKPSGRVVFIFPAFKNGPQLTKTSDRVLPEIKKLGFQPTQLIPQHNTVNSILYSRPDQKILREIFVLEFIPSPHLFDLHAMVCLLSS